METYEDRFLSDAQIKGELVPFVVLSAQARSKIGHFLFIGTSLVTAQIGEQAM